MTNRDVIDDARIKEILHQILRYASGDLDFRGETSEHGDIFDAVIGGLNILGEEFRSYVSEIKTAKEKAIEGEKLKSAFLNNISHEIRTPVSIIIGLTDILKNSELRNEEELYYLNLISENANNLLKTITDIIDISSIEINIENVYLSEFCLNRLIIEIISENKNNLSYEKKTKLNFVFKPPEEKELYISTDKSKLSRTINILLDNAIKFTAEGKISIDYFISNKFLFFNIKDTGIGIDKEQQNFIFEKFRQGDEKLKRKYGGSGLGLTIAKALVEKMGGKIWVNSQKEIGSTFSFNIPFIAVKKSKIRKNPSETNHSVNAKKFKGKTILIVEDDFFTFIILKKYLETTNSNIIHVEDGIEAVNACRNNKNIDIVLMDIELPGIDGIIATKTIKTFRPNLPIISHTANDLKENRNKSLAAGCVDYLAKPAKKSELMKLLNRYLT